ncbi:MAG: tetratricopeptide repeat protein [bacterium]
MAEKGNDSENSGITPEDYESLIKIQPRNLILIFLVISLIIGGVLYGFSYIQRRNSNLKVEEARVLIDRGDTAPSSPTPRTLELEEMVARTEQDVNWLVDQLVADSFAVKIDKRLQERYRQQMYFSSRQELSDDWKDNLPDELKQWRKKKIGRRRAQLKQFIDRLDEFVAEQRQRVQRLDEIRNSLAEKGKMPPVGGRYKEARSRLVGLLDEIEKQLENVSIEGYELPDKLYNPLARLVDPLSKFTLQYRRYNGLTSAPAAYLYAEQYLRDALRIDPQNPEAFYQLGRVYERMGKDVISSEHYLRMVKEAPYFHRVDDVVGKFEKIVEEKPGSSRAHYDLGFAYYEVGRRKEALEQLLKVLEGECNTGSLEFIAETYAAGRKKEARKLVDEMIARTGCNSRSMTQVLARLRIGYLLGAEPPYHKMAYH